ncbi:MAG: PDZ domain-containing protein [Planctomycetota bacterium]
MSSRLILIAGCALIAVSIFHSETSAAEEKETAKLPQQAIEYILDLESDDFQKREKATRALPAYGQPVIEPLLKVTRGDSLEAAVRAILVIEAIYIQGKENSISDAEDALDLLTHAANPSVAIRAEEAIDRHTDIREKRAVREIRKRGGTVKLWTAEEIARAPQGIRAQPGQVRYIALGSKWNANDQEQGLRFIKRVGHFEVLYMIKGHRLPDLAQEDLMRALPATRFQTRESDAMLGISGGSGTDQGGCTVGDVSEGLAAQKAGIQTNDFIIEFEGEKVENFESLVKLIGKKEAGDTVEVELIRNGVPLTLKVTLSSWLDK